MALGAALLLMMTSVPIAGADALEGLVQADWITGTCGRPDSADALQASFLVSYRYPQFVCQQPTDEAINRYYQALEAQLAIAGLEADASIDCEVTHSSERYVSVLETTTTLGGNGETQTLRSDTFARDGIYAGQKLNLSHLLGLEEQTALAEELVYQLVWQIVQRNAENAEGDYLDGLTQLDVANAFYPQTDFYLDGDGNIVFWIPAGEIAGEIAGILLFPFSMAELLSAI